MDRQTPGSIDPQAAEPQRLNQMGAEPSAQMVRVMQRVGASAQAKSRLFRRAGWFTIISLGSSWATAAAAAVGGAKAVGVVASIGIAVGVYSLSNTYSSSDNSSSDDSSSQPQVEKPEPPPPALGLPPPPKENAELPAISVDELEQLTPSEKVNTREVQRKPGKQPLSHEIKLIDAARAAVRSGNGQVALSKLKLYRARFPGGRLSLEANALRIEALAATGRTQQAQRLAQRFVERHPKSLLVARVRPYAKSSATSSDNSRVEGGDRTGAEEGGDRTGAEGGDRTGAEGVPSERAQPQAEPGAGAGK